MSLSQDGQTYNRCSVYGVEEEIRITEIQHGKQDDKIIMDIHCLLYSTGNVAVFLYVNVIRVAANLKLHKLITGLNFVTNSDSYCQASLFVRYLSALLCITTTR